MVREMVENGPKQFIMTVFGVKTNKLTYHFSVMALELQAKVIPLNKVQMQADHLEQNPARCSMLLTTKHNDYFLVRTNYA